MTLVFLPGSALVGFREESIPASAYLAVPVALGHGRCLTNRGRLLRREMTGVYELSRDMTPPLLGELHLQERFSQ